VLAVACCYVDTVLFLQLFYTDSYIQVFWSVVTSTETSIFLQARKGVEENERFLETFAEFILSVNESLVVPMFLYSLGWFGIQEVVRPDDNSVGCINITYVQPG